MLPRSRTISNFYLLLLLAGFFSIGLLSNLIPGGSRRVTIPYRATILILSLFLIVTGALKKRSLFPIGSLRYFFIFWWLYLSRLIIDLYFLNIQATVFETNFDYILNAIGICLLPSLAISYLKEIDFDWILKWFFWILLVSLVISLFLNLNLDPEEMQKGYGRYGGGKALNTISYGHQGVTLSLLSLFLFSKTSKLKNIIFYLSSFLLGLFIMYLAGSKSPLLALLLCGSFYYLSSKGIIKGTAILTIFILPLVLFGKTIANFLSQYGGSFLDRVVKLLDSGDAGRNMLFTEGISQFENSPVLGNSFVLQGYGLGQWNGFYPHNIVIESFMAIGIVGGLIVIALIINGMYCSYKLAVTLSPNGWISMLFIQYTTLAMFSNAIYTNHYFWYYYVLVLGAHYKNSRTPS